MKASPSIDFNPAAAGYDRPIELWLACHHRIARMNSLLQRLVEHLKQHPVDEHAGVTAASIVRYFDEALPRHHEDEEIDLFPRLLDKLRAQSSGPAAETVGATVASLLADHEEMAALWQSMRTQLQAVAAGRDPLFDDAQVLLFVTRFRAHLEVEDGTLAPVFKRMFRAKDLREIGRTMARRRGVDWNPERTRPVPR
jgi:pyridoxamine 5'-phosphate oxidase